MGKSVVNCGGRRLLILSRLLGGLFRNGLRGCSRSLSERARELEAGDCCHSFPEELYSQSLNWSQNGNGTSKHRLMESNQLDQAYLSTFQKSKNREEKWNPPLLLHSRNRHSVEVSLLMEARLEERQSDSVDSC